jgi:hypothetical protein
LHAFLTKKKKKILHAKNFGKRSGAVSNPSSSRKRLDLIASTISNTSPSPALLCSISVYQYSCRPMALLLCNVIHPKPPLLKVQYKRLHSDSNTRLRVYLPNTSSTSRRRIIFPPPKSASINGFPIHNSPEASREKNIEPFERLRRWIRVVGSVLPGGKWWSFDEDVELKLLAEPVTVSRALTRMWNLVAQDRWVIFAAFAALILAAVRVFTDFVSSLAFRSVYLFDC